jgi:hypothetical protein
VLDSLNLKESVYAAGIFSIKLGSMSLCVGRFMSETLEDARKENQKSAALILIDRVYIFNNKTLDLVSPTAHTDNIMDLVFNLLPRYDQDSIEVRLEENLLFPHLNDKILDVSVSHNSNGEAIRFIETAIQYPINDALELACDELKKIAQHGTEKAQFDNESVDKSILNISKNPSLILKNEDLLYILLSIISAGRKMAEAKQSELQNIENLLTKTLVNSGDPNLLIEQIVDVLSKMSNSKLQNAAIDTFSTKDILLCTMFAYSLIGVTHQVSPTSETMIKHAFANAMISVRVCNLG